MQVCILKKYYNNILKLIIVMKKILLSVLSLFMAVVNMSASDNYIVDNGKVGDNWFVGANLGGTWGLINHDRSNAFWGDINPQFTIKGGKYITPIVGIQVELESGFAEGNKTFFDHTNLTLDWLCNFNNLFCGYKGEPRFFEVVGVLGSGWFHSYGNVSNSASVKGAVELNFNFAKSTAWQLNIIPSFTYLPARGIEHSYVSLSAGFTYKFKNNNGTRKFTKVQIRDQKEIDAFNAKLEELLKENNVLREQNSRLTNLNNRQEATINELEEKLKNIDNGETLEISNAVGFTIGSSTISKAQEVNIALIANALTKYENTNIEIIGYADRETGNSEINQKLSYDRAFAIKDLLINKYGINEDRISIIAKGDTEQPFNENNLNRVAIFIKK